MPNLVTLLSSEEVIMVADKDSSSSHSPSSPTALITGASRGLGKALARTLAGAGARVVLVARSREPLATLVREIRGSGGEAWAIAADLADKRAIHRVTG